MQVSTSSPSTSNAISTLRCCQRVCHIGSSSLAAVANGGWAVARSADGAGTGAGGCVVPTAPVGGACAVGAGPLGTRLVAWTFSLRAGAGGVACDEARGGGVADSGETPASGGWIPRDSATILTARVMEALMTITEIVAPEMASTLA